MRPNEESVNRASMRCHPRRCGHTENLLRRLRNGLERVGCLSGCQPSELGACECERGRDEDGAEALETMAEGSWVVPVPGSYISTRIGRHATAVDDNAQDDEAGASNDSVMEGYNQRLSRI